MSGNEQKRRGPNKRRTVGLLMHRHSKATQEIVGQVEDDGTPTDKIRICSQSSS